MHPHFTPTYAYWINQLERPLAEVTRDLLQRSDHGNVQTLEKDLHNRVRQWNENPQPIIWTKTAEKIFEQLGRPVRRVSGAGA